MNEDEEDKKISVDTDSEVFDIRWIEKKHNKIKALMMQAQDHWFDVALNTEALIPQWNVDDLYEFAHDDDVWNPAIAIFGKRRTGKSTLCKDLLVRLNDHIGRISIITDTSQNGFWETFIPEATTYPVDLAAMAIEEILSHQAELKNLVAEGKFNKLNPKGVIQHTVILDDFAHDKKFSRYSDAFGKIFTAGRHFNVAVILLSQQPQAVATIVRENADFVFVVKISGERNVKYISEDHMHFMHKTASRMIMDNTTLDHQVLVINKTPLVKDHDRLGVFKAEKIDYKFKLGNEQWRKLIESGKYSGGKRNVKNEISDIRDTISRGKRETEGGIRKFLEYSYDAYRYN